MEFLYQYGLFLAQAVTVVVAFVVIIAAIGGLKEKTPSGELVITDMSRALKNQTLDLKERLMDKKAFKALEKATKKAEKEQEKAKKQDKSQASGDAEEAEQSSAATRLFYLSFKGSIDAKEVESLRREISAILSVAEKGDEVLINIESGGGMVHGYGLAASQLDRLKRADITLTACVDKVAASGGYMMACVADKLYSAPFAIVGSIGVVAQLPNFNRLLKKNRIDIEQHTAGNYKRTLTMLGENTDEGREKFKEELAETHQLFKQYVGERRPQVDLEKVATGEHWYGQQAIELQLVDEISTSDDLLLDAAKSRKVFKVEYKAKKKLAEKLGHGAQSLIKSIQHSLVQKEY